MATAQEELAESWARGLARGLIAGERRAIRLAVKARGLTLTGDQSAKIDACEDIAVLRDWTEAAVTASRTDQIFR